MRTICDDGLTTLPVGIWVEHKYNLLENYLKIFSTGMKNAWKIRTYIDLFAGPGCSKIEESGKILNASPLIALGVKDPFNKYIFCEENPENYSALKMRVLTSHADKNVDIINGNCNEMIQNIIEKIPFNSLSFCYLDPFDMGIHFDTIRLLAQNRRIDILILLAYSMDANRNERNYLAANNNKIELFLGNPNWRKIRSDNIPQISFIKFLSDEFEKKLFSIGYTEFKGGNKIEIRNPEKNQSLYHLAFYSKNEKGYDFWKKIQHYSSPQLSLEL